jgi:hypothetical protein
VDLGLGSGRALPHPQRREAMAHLDEELVRWGHEAFNNADVDELWA